MLEKEKQTDAIWEPGTAEPGRLVISLYKSNLTGRELYDRLREKYHLQMEMCGADYVVAILSMMDEWEGLERLAKALKEIDTELSEKEKAGELFGESIAPTKLLSLADAFTAESEEVILEDAIGRAVSDFINLYPPGIPLLAPGECLDNKIYVVIKGYLENNYVVQGINNDLVRGEVTIKVVKRG